MDPKATILSLMDAGHILAAEAEARWRQDHARRVASMERRPNRQRE
jgi:hypothetical protein